MGGRRQQQQRQRRGRGNLIAPSTRFIRRAGRAGLLGGSILLWSAAEGSRGIRWRASISVGDRLTSDLLLEVGLDGRPGRLEITSAAGQLTIHPEPDQRSAHGNLVTTDGVRPLSFEWSPGDWFESRENPIPAAAMIRALRAEVGVGESRPVRGLQVDSDLQVRRGERRVARLDADRWSIEGADGFRCQLALDDEGLPIFEPGTPRDPGSAAAQVWPQEVETETP
jgi:hypothetical protein